LPVQRVPQRWPGRRSRAGIADPPAAAHVEEAITTAREQGWLGGPKTRVIRARTNAALVDEAKRRTGIRSDTELIEAALAGLATHDDFAEWPISQKGHRGPFS
jgi:hypothetical protein